MDKTYKVDSMTQRWLVYVCSAVVIAGLAGCSTINQAHHPVQTNVSSSEHFSATKPQQVTFHDDPNKPYVIVGRVYVQRQTLLGHNRGIQQAKHLMRQRAAQLGGDAIINLHKTHKQHVGTIVHYL